ncbi:MAG: hypothetical protein N2Z64_02835 [Dictyoglomus thermophilum]|uniref:Uncharacterized protein n=1 Tax=Dictyoglomus thermophilum TaxID=14 RepID=A0A7C2CLZ5_DICTH|nr:hypothetical protein [Dictyoglomus thermophilum]MCX7720196.1 hypothetical protein [Dictyoglomus thermophilum]TYT23336.1 hypothetical protein FY122_03725 [Dictyoglomus thermophilum]
MEILRYFLILIIFLILIQVAFGSMIPVVENRSIVIAKVKAIVHKEFPFSEIVVEVVRSESVEGFKNFAKVGDIIPLYPLSLNANLENIDDFRKKVLYTCYFLKPGDLVKAEIEFVGDEARRGWVIRDIERIIEVNEGLLKDVIYSFLKAKGFIKDKEELKYEVFKDGENYRVEVILDNKKLTIILDKSYVILNYF